MAAGTYHGHAEMEKLLDLGTLSATSEPITDAAMDEITGITEGVADAHIRGKTGRTLANAYAANNKACVGLLMELSRKYFLAHQGSTAYGVVSDAQGSKTRTTYKMSWQPEFSALVALASSGGTVMGVGDTVDPYNLSG